MLDTNICVYAIQGGNEHLDQRFGECEAGDLVMSAVTLGELETWFAKSGDQDGARKDLAPVLADIVVMPFDAAAARTFGRIQAVAPSGCNACDHQIAAHAISLGLVVITNNEKDFSGIPGIVIENWTMP